MWLVPPCYLTLIKAISVFDTWRPNVDLVQQGSVGDRGLEGKAGVDGIRVSCLYQISLKQELLILNVWNQGCQNNFWMTVHFLSAHSIHQQCQIRSATSFYLARENKASMILAKSYQHFKLSYIIKNNLQILHFFGYQHPFKLLEGLINVWVQYFFQIVQILYSKTFLSIKGWVWSSWTSRCGWSQWCQGKTSWCLSFTLKDINILQYWFDSIEWGNAKPSFSVCVCVFQGETGSPGPNGRRGTRGVPVSKTPWSPEFIMNNHCCFWLSSVYHL